jgi:hypothetical protein
MKNVCRVRPNFSSRGGGLEERKSGKVVCFFLLFFSFPSPKGWKKKVLRNEMALKFK